MCRNIKTLHNFKPPATYEEVHASSLQFVRKLSGFTRPSKANELAFNRAVHDVTHAAHALLDSLVTSAPRIGTAERTNSSTARTPSATKSDARSRALRRFRSLARLNKRPGGFPCI